MRSRSRKIDSLNYCIAFKFDKHLGSSAADVPVKFQSDRAILNTNLAASKLYEHSCVCPHHFWGYYDEPMIYPVALGPHSINNGPMSIYCWPRVRNLFCFGSKSEFLTRLTHFYTFYALPGTIGNVVCDLLKSLYGTIMLNEKLNWCTQPYKIICYIIGRRTYIIIVFHI